MPPAARPLLHSTLPSPIALRAIGGVVRAGLVSIALFLFSATGAIVYDDYSMAAKLVSMDRDRCASIANASPQARSRNAFETCVSRTSARERDYRYVAIAHAVVAFLALIGLPGIVTFVIAAMLHRSRNTV